MNRNAGKWAFLLLILMVFGSIINAQPSFNFAEIKNANPQEDIFILKQKESILIEQKKEQLIIYTENATDILYLTEKATHMAGKSIYYYDQMTSISDIKAKTWVPSGSKMKSFDVDEDNITTRKTVRDGVFFDDFMEKSFMFPALQPGAVSSLTYTEATLDPHFLGSFYFGSYAPIANAEFKITFPESVKVKYKLNDKNKIIEFREERSKGMINYIFTAKNIKSYTYESDAPDLSYVTPNVILYIDSYQYNGKSVPVLSGLPELYDWYMGLLSQMKNNKGPEMKSLVDSLTAGITNQDDKIRKIFYWVQDNIKYIAFEEGLGGFVPREPIDIFHKRYGDCKDKTVILVALFSEAGILAHPAWIGTRDIPFQYSEVATPVVSNHMIVALPTDKGWQFLDGTAEHLPYGMPTSMIQGKEAMINVSPDTFLVVKVPEMEGNKNLTSETYAFTLTDGKIVGKGSQSWMGYPDQLIYYSLSQVSAQKRIEGMEKSLDIGNNKYSASNLEFTHYGNRDSALVVSFDFNISDYVSEADNMSYLNMHLKKPFIADKMDLKKRVNDRVFDYKILDSISTVFDVPANYEIVDIPKNRSFSDPEFGFVVEYVHTGNKISLQRKVWVNTLLLTKDKFPKWNEMIDLLTLSYKELLILKKK